MKKIAKGFGVGILIALFGLLVFGAVNFTAAKSEEETNTEYVAYSAVDEAGYGTSSVQTTEEISDHEPLYTDILLLPTGEVSQDEVNAILYMREEEKLARDVYQYFAELWGMPSFSNIARSEQVHMDLVLDLIDRYELTDPATADAGVFVNPDLQALYNLLIAQGSVSVEEAFKVGAAIEEIDILDLQERMDQTDQADIQQVFDSLMLGSYNHLSAFVTNMANRYGITYAPQYISEDLFQEILQSSSTNGGGFGNGQGGAGNGAH